MSTLDPADRTECDAVVLQLCSEIRTALARDDLELAVSYLGAIEARVATITKAVQR